MNEEKSGAQWLALQPHTKKHLYVGFLMCIYSLGFFFGFFSQSKNMFIKLSNCLYLAMQ